MANAALYVPSVIHAVYENGLRAAEDQVENRGQVRAGHLDAISRVDAVRRALRENPSALRVLHSARRSL